MEISELLDNFQSYLNKLNDCLDLRPLANDDSDELIPARNELCKGAVTIEKLMSRLKAAHEIGVTRTSELQVCKL